MNHKANPKKEGKQLIYMATPAGFEPATCPLGGGGAPRKIWEIPQKSGSHSSRVLYLSRESGFTQVQRTKEHTPSPALFGEVS